MLAYKPWKAFLLFAFISYFTINKYALVLEHLLCLF